MAHKPEQICISTWVSPEQLRRLDSLVNLSSTSRAEMLRRLIDQAARRQITALEQMAAVTNEPEREIA
jgi:hypothetical protein